MSNDCRKIVPLLKQVWQMVDDQGKRAVLNVVEVTGCEKEGQDIVGRTPFSESKQNKALRSLILKEISKALEE